MSESIIPVVAALICDARGCVLLVRKRGTAAFMQPGGKREAGESDVAALVREVGEELGCRVSRESARALGVFDAPAANEPGFTVRAAVYAVDVEGAIAPQAEIDQVVWVDPQALPDLPFAPLTRDHVLPLAQQAGKFQRLKALVAEGMADVEAGRVAAWNVDDFLHKTRSIPSK